MKGLSLHYDTHSLAKTGGFDTTFICRETGFAAKREKLFELLEMFDVEWRDEWYGDTTIGYILTFNDPIEYDLFVNSNIIMKD